MKKLELPYLDTITVKGRTYTTSGKARQGYVSRRRPAATLSCGNTGICVVGNPLRRPGRLGTD